MLPLKPTSVPRPKTTRRQPTGAPLVSGGRATFSDNAMGFALDLAVPFVLPSDKRAIVAIAPVGK